MCGNQEKKPVSSYLCILKHLMDAKLNMHDIGQKAKLSGYIVPCDQSETN